MPYAAVVVTPVTPVSSPEPYSLTGHPGVGLSVGAGVGATVGEEDGLGVGAGAGVGAKVSPTPVGVVVLGVG